MRHRKARKKTGRTGAHQRAMISNMMMALVEHGRIETTARKAWELRRIAEKLVTRAASLGDILLKDWDNLGPEDNARLVHAIRMTRRTLRDRGSVIALFDNIAPRYIGRPGGYMRIIKKGFRKGDGAPIAILEFVEAAMPAREGAAPKGEEQKKGPLSWFRRNTAE